MIVTAIGLTVRASAQSGLSNAQYRSGQSVAPVFEGWLKNADGTYDLTFGYLNRNYEEQPEIPIGPDNSFSPGAPDRGQPTHFYPRRQQFMFKIRVPADFGKQELTWTLTRGGRTDKAVAHLALEWELTEVVYSQNRRGLASDAVKAVPGTLPPTPSESMGKRRPPPPAFRSVSRPRPRTMAIQSRRRRPARVAGAGGGPPPLVTGSSSAAAKSLSQSGNGLAVAWSAGGTPRPSVGPRYGQCVRAAPTGGLG